MIDQIVALNRIREIIALETGIERVYSQSSDDENALPDALSEWPTVLVMVGPTLEHIVTQPAERLTYEVKVQLYGRRMGDQGGAAAQILPLNVAIRRAFISNVTLGGRVNSCRIDRDTGLVVLQYAGIDYAGIEFTFVVSEHATADAEPGS